VTEQPRTLLGSLVSRSNKAHEEHVAALQALARQMQEPDATFSPRQFARWLAGGVGWPRAATRRVLEAYYQRTTKALLGPPSQLSDPAPYAAAPSHEQAVATTEGSIVISDHESPGGPGGSHPRAPTERNVTVSRHSARLIRSV
jgi:hypothetical protein